MSLFREYLAVAARAPFSQFWLDVAVKATALLLAAILAAAILRRSSAALRHQVWCLTFAALLLLPGLSAALPKWRLPILPAEIEQKTVPGVSTHSSPQPLPNPVAEAAGAPLSERGFHETAPGRAAPTAGAATAMPPPQASLAAGDEQASRSTDAPRLPGAASVWLLGAGLALSSLMLGLARMLILRRRSRPIGDAAWAGLFDELRARLGLARRVDLLETAAAVMPMTWGLRRPAVLLPSQARGWTERLRRIVLLHELAHVKRYDVGFQMLGRATCALYWFHPLAWYALRRLRIERELACDDCVVHTGELASDYAAELLQIARSYRPVRLAAGVAMAQRSSLEHRIRALFDRACSHLPVSARAARLLLASVVVLVTVVAAVRLAPRAAAGDDKQAPASEGAPSESDDDLVTVAGTVVDPRDKPFASAKIFAVRWYWEPHIPHAPLAETTSDADGRFAISFRKSQFNADVGRRDQWKETAIVATAEGAGPGWVTWRDVPPGEEPTLKLVPDDVPITGRVVDLEGNPVEGVSVRIGSIHTGKDGRLDGWLDAVRRGEFPWTAVRHLDDSLPQFDAWPPRVVTGSDGRFRIQGIGRERSVKLSFTGPTIAYQEATVVTRQSDSLRLKVSTMSDESKSVYGAAFELAAPPTQPIFGVVLDAETHQPLAGVSVESDIFAGSNFANERHLRAVSDEAGRYRLVGMPKGKGNQLLAVPNDDQPYFMREIKVPESRGLGPVELDIEVHRGIWITGRVTDKSTGKPLIARLHYLPFRSNEYARKTPEFSDQGRAQGFQDRYVSQPDGAYRLVGLPGRAIVGAECVIGRYRAGAGAEAIEGLDDQGNFDTYRNPIGPGKGWPHAMKEINPNLGTETVVCDLALDPGDKITVNVLDREGKPVSGFETEGGTQSGFGSPGEQASFDVINLGPDETRTVIIRHKQRRIGKVIRLRLADHPTGAATISLEPTAKVIGRLLDKSGEPVSGAEVIAWVLPIGDFTERLSTVTTDEHGRFEYANIPTGCHYDLHAEAAGVRQPGGLVTDLALEPSETKDLGDVTYGSAVEGEKKPKADAGTKTGAAAPESSERSGIVTLRGQVLDPGGKALLGAKLYLSYPARDPLEPQLLGTSDAAGRFEFRVDTSKLDRSLMPDPWPLARLTAAAKGYGAEWTAAAQAAAAGDCRLQLVKDVPIHGRILTLEGKPAPGAQVRFRQLCIPAENNLDAYIEAKRSGRNYRFERLASKMAGVSESAVVDEQGRFTLEGYGAERLVELIIDGPGIEHWFIHVMTRETEAVVTPQTVSRVRPDRAYGARFDHLAPPSRKIVGIVRQRGSDKPIAGVIIQALGQTTHRATTDAEGRFELLGAAKAKSYSLDAKAENLPYFSAQVRIADTPGLESVQVEIDLDRGIEATGRVSVGESGRPNPASVDYLPLLRNPHVARFGRSIGQPCSSAVCDANGRYSIPVLPGPGVLCYRCGPYGRDVYTVYMSAYVTIQEIADFYRSVGLQRPTDVGEGLLPTAPLPVAVATPSGYNQVVFINPSEDEQSLTFDAQIPIGRVVKGTMLDPAGQPLAGAEILGLSNSPFEERKLDTAEFEVTALNPRQQRTLIVRDRERNLAAYRLLAGDEAGPIELHLQPCGSILGRLFDKDGEAVANTQLGVFRPRYAQPDFMTATDTEGRFRFDGLVPGVDYEIGLRDRGGLPKPIQTATLKPGEIKDLGNLKQMK